MKYYEKSIIDTIKKYYPIELQIEYSNIDGTFFRKEKENIFLAYSLISNSETEFVIYLFQSENEKEPLKFIEDFNERDIAFRINDIKILEIILNANSLELLKNDQELTQDVREKAKNILDNISK